MNVNNLASWVAIAATAAGGAMWVGAQGNEIENQKEAIQEVKNLPVDVAVLKTQSEAMQKTLEEVKQQNKAILEALQRRP